MELLSKRHHINRKSAVAKKYFAAFLKTKGNLHGRHQKKNKIFLLISKEPKNHRHLEEAKNRRHLEGAITHLDLTNLTRLRDLPEPEENDRTPKSQHPTEKSICFPPSSRWSHLPLPWLAVAERYCQPSVSFKVQAVASSYGLLNASTRPNQSCATEKSPR
jgi:hypothetical protein